MATNVITLWDLHIWDGCDRTNYATSFTNQQAATACANQYDSVYERKIVIHESPDDYKQWKSGEVRRRALSKLSEEERVALGLKEEA